MYPRARRQPAAPTSGAVTLVVAAALAIRASGAWRLWAPVIGIAVGCAVAALFGLYDIERVIEAPWVAVPTSGWSGFDLRFGPSFWVLLPAFSFVILVSTIKTIGDTVAIQQVSRRKPRAVDFRTVQGAVTAEGLGNLLSGAAGTMPNMTWSTSASIVELTGVAARSVGVCIGIVFVVLAFLPKATAFLLAVPNPVAAAYMTVLCGLLFVQGMRIAIQDGIDHRKATIVGLAFWIGVGFQNQAIFADRLGETWGALLGNGMTAGGLAAVALTFFMELTGPRRRRLKTELHISALPKIDEFLRVFASRIGWDDAATQRLRSAGEEALASLVRQDDDAAANGRRLLIVARRDGGAAELEFVATSDEENLEDRLAHLSELPETPDEREISFRLLRHYASSVRHQKYHDLDIVTVHVTNVS